MRLNILIGGKAGQGINKVSEIVAKTLIHEGYYVFNYRDYPSLIMGGHNFNVVSISDKPIGSHESKLDGIIAVDEATKKIHKQELKKNGFLVDYKAFSGLGRNINIALAGAVIKILGIERKILLDIVKKNLKNKKTLYLALDAAKMGYDSQKSRYSLKKHKRKLSYSSGSKALADGAINSGINIYIAYPMTPATNAMHELAGRQLEHGYMVYQPEGEIAAVNMAMGASFAGAKVMVGTSGGGFDLMTEGLSMQGSSEIPLVVYLSARAGAGTGIPTYTAQSDTNIALYSGHGEFPRVVIAPGDPVEMVEKTNEAFYLANKFGTLSIILADKHVSESEFTSDEKVNKILPVKVTRKVPGEGVVRATSYERDKEGITTEDPVIATRNGEFRLKRYSAIEKEAAKLENYKIHGKKSSKNVVIGFGSTKHAILDAIDGLDYKFIQVLYLSPFPDIEKELKKARKIVLVENNLTGQLGELIRQKTGIEIKKKILKNDGRPFFSDELRRKLR